MKCIIADDHGMLRKGLSELLKTIEPDLHITEVGSFPALIEQLSLDPDIDLVLLDLVIPGSTGLEGLKQLKKQWPATAVIMVSSTEDPIIIRSAISSGASGYVPKSTPVEHLPSAFQLILAGGIYVPPVALGTDISVGTGGEKKNRPDFIEQGLSARQNRILVCIAEGMSNKEIAAELELAEQTVKNEVSRLFRILGVANRAQAAVFVKSRYQPSEN